MPDISMCRNELCPSNKHCYRFRATPDRWQSYSDFKFDAESGKCSEYIQMRPPGVVKKMKIKKVKVI